MNKLHKSTSTLSYSSPFNVDSEQTLQVIVRNKRVRRTPNSLSIVFRPTNVNYTQARRLLYSRDEVVCLRIGYVLFIQNDMPGWKVMLQKELCRQLDGGNGGRSQRLSRSKDGAKMI